MKNKKMIGALIAGLFILLYYGFLLGVVILGQIHSYEKIPVFLFILIVGALLIPIIGIISVLIMRMKEIEKGEEEEAKKY